MHTEINLTETIKGCIGQDIRHQKILYQWCYPPMLRICKRYCFNEQDASSLLNEAMLKVFRNIANYKDSNQLLAWIKTIVINTCIDKVRLKATYNHREIDEAEEVFIAANEETYSHMQAKEILLMVKELPEHIGIVFNLYAIEGFKHEEIAQILGIPIGTSKWHLSEARKMLKKKLEQSFKQEPVTYGK